MKRIDFHAMGSRMMAAIDSSHRDAARELQQVPLWFEQWEQTLSRFRCDSELYRLNQRRSGPLVVSETLWEVYHAAMDVERMTGGLVTPSVLDAMLEAGYDRSFEQMLPGNLPSGGRSHESREWKSLNTDPATHTLWLPEQVQLDFGGIAKGWAARKAVERLQPYGPSLVDAGGDIAISAPPLNRPAWPIGVTDPFHEGKHFETLKLKTGGVATSGIDFHRWQQGGTWKHHIIDTRTGMPAATDLLTVTVIAPDLIQAEAAAKYVLIAGSESGLEWLDADEDLAGVLVLQTGEWRYSRRMPEFLWRENE